MTRKNSSVERAPRRRISSQAERDSKAGRDSKKKIAQQLAQKVRIKILGSYAITSYIFIVAVILCFAYLSLDSYVEKKRLEMEAAAYEIEMNFANMLAHAESVLGCINRSVVSSGSTNAEITEILTSFGESYRGENSIKDALSVGTFYWINSSKHLVASSAGPIVAPIDLSHRDYLGVTEKDPWNIHTGLPTIGVVSGQHVIPAGVGVVDANKRYLGTAVLSFKTQSLVEKFRSVTAFYKTDFAILDNQNNKVLMESDIDLFSGKEDVTEGLKISGDSLHPELVSSFAPWHYDGNFTMIRAMEKYPYKILVSYKNKDLLRDGLVEAAPHFLELVVMTIFFAMVFVIIIRVDKNPKNPS